MDTLQGSEIYRRTLTFICAKAAQKLFPKRHFTIGHSLGTAYYIELEDKENKPITDDDLKKLDEEMRSIIKKALPINPRTISWYDAVTVLEKANIPEALCLIKSRNTPRVSVVECEGFFVVAQDAYLDNTSKTPYFLLIKYGSPQGFLLHYPRKRTPFVLDAFIDQPKLFSAFQSTQFWEKKAGVVCIGDVNEIVRSTEKHRLRDFVVFCEAIHDRMFVETATKATQNPATKIILIAGPSSSGKTTFARKLCVNLKVLGKDPVCISLDDFFHEPKDNPIDPETGKPDFEALESLDLKLINDTFLALLKGETVEMPHYNFVTQKREWKGKKLSMSKDSVLVVEGIHGLNDKLTEMIPKEAKFKVFISALTRLNVDEHHRVSTTDDRMLRRMVRDFQFRGTSAAVTISRWPSVRKGEEKHIFPFQNTADIIFNSSVEYEINALKTIAEPLLKNIVPSQKDVYPEAQRLIKFLSNFDQMGDKFIPPAALIREFLGGSLFSD